MHSHPLTRVQTQTELLTQTNLTFYLGFINFFLNKKHSLTTTGAQLIYERVPFAIGWNKLNHP